MLLRAAELYGPRQEEWRRLPYSPISHGVFAEGALRLGWSTGGMRPAYSYDRHGLFNDFDLLAPGMDAATRDKIIRGFPEYATKLGDEGLINLEGIVDGFQFLYKQPRNAWSFEVDVRTSQEKW